MGYDIYIGNAVVESDYEFDERLTFRSEMFVRVNRQENPDAPTFINDEYTGKSNSRHPSYTGWLSFCNKTDLRNFFFDPETGLMRTHPGTFPIYQDDLDIVERKVAEWEDLYKDLQPGFNHVLHYAGYSDQDMAYARLLWLKWWMRWTLQNCECPAIFNG